MNSLGSNREAAENKLILLYLIDRLNLPVSNLQITKLILEFRFMNYFMLQQYLNELYDAKLLDTEETGDKILYSINASGRTSLEYFSNMIPKGLKARMDEFYCEARKNIRNETLVTADYTPESESKFTVSCKVGEDDFPLLELMLTVGTKSDARLVCDNWRRHTQTIYSEIIEALTKKRD